LIQHYLYFPCGYCNVQYYKFTCFDTTLFILSLAIVTYNTTSLRHPARTESEGLSGPCLQ